MNNFRTCEIENTVTALQEEIKYRKLQMQDPQPGASGGVSHLLSEILNRTAGSYGQINQTLQRGGEFAQEFLSQARQSVQERPWEVLRKVAVCSFALGLFLSLRNRKSSEKGEE